MEIRAAGVDRLFPLLIPMLSDPAPEVRCSACDVLRLLNDRRGVELVLPLLRDLDAVVRLCACECLWKFGDDRGVAPLLEVLKTDVDAQVRNMAVSALTRSEARRSYRSCSRPWRPITNSICTGTRQVGARRWPSTIFWERTKLAFAFPLPVAACGPVSQIWIGFGVLPRHDTSSG